MGNYSSLSDGVRGQASRCYGELSCLRLRVEILKSYLNERLIVVTQNVSQT